MLEALRRGDRVVTGGGIVGTVSKVVSNEEVEVDIAQGVRVRVLRSTISSVLAKPDPSAAREAARDKDKAAAGTGADKA
jgi:preprotein translocase subunit YajC